MIDVRCCGCGTMSRVSRFRDTSCVGCWAPFLIPERTPAELREAAVFGVLLVLLSVCFAGMLLFLRVRGVT